VAVFSSARRPYGSWWRELIALLNCEERWQRACVDHALAARLAPFEVNIVEDVMDSRGLEYVPNSHCGAFSHAVVNDNRGKGTEREIVHMTHAQPTPHLSRIDCRTHAVACRAQRRNDRERQVLEHYEPLVVAERFKRLRCHVSGLGV